MSAAQKDINSKQEEGVKEKVTEPGFESQLVDDKNSKMKRL